MFAGLIRRFRGLGGFRVLDSKKTGRLNLGSSSSAGRGCLPAARTRLTASEMALLLGGGLKVQAPLPHFVPRV